MARLSRITETRKDLANETSDTHPRLNRRADKRQAATKCLSVYGARPKPLQSAALALKTPARVWTGALRTRE